MTSPYDAKGNPGHPGVTGKPFRDDRLKMPDEQKDVVPPGVRTEPPSTDKVPLNEGVDAEELVAPVVQGEEKSNSPVSENEDDDEDENLFSDDEEN